MSIFFFWWCLCKAIPWPIKTIISLSLHQCIDFDVAQLIEHFMEHFERQKTKRTNRCSLSYGYLKWAITFDTERVTSPTKYVHKALEDSKIQIWIYQSRLTPKFARLEATSDCFNLLCNFRIYLSLSVISYFKLFRVCFK